MQILCTAEDVYRGRREVLRTKCHYSRLTEVYVIEADSLCQISSLKKLIFKHVIEADSLC